jgi:diguanylate cyclase (GGDEF)-like protein
VTALRKFALLFSLIWLAGSGIVGWQVARETQQVGLGLLVAALVGSAGLFATTTVLLLRQMATVATQRERLQELTQEWQAAQHSLQQLLRQRDQLGLLVRLMQRFVSAAHQKEILTVLLSELGLFFRAETVEGILFDDPVLHGIWHWREGQVSVREGQKEVLSPNCPWADPNGFRPQSSQEVVIPVLSDGKMMAAFRLVRSAPFDPDDRQFLEVIAAQVSLALSRIKFIATLQTLSVTDALTGVPNRRYWDLRLAEEIARAQRYRYPLAVLMVDIDHFKRVNDTYGHQVGDVALQQVASRLRSNLRRTDVLARYGGEEFGVLAPQTSLEAAKVLAERLRHAIASEPIWVNSDLSIPLTISVGVAVFPEHGQNESDLVAAADAALYRAKEEGRNCVRVAESLRVERRRTKC